MKNHIELRFNFLKLITVVVLFFPQFQKFIGLAFEQLMTVAVTVLLFLFFFKDKYHTVFLSVVVSLIFLIIFLIDLFRSINFLIINDFFEIIKPFSFFIYFFAGYSLLNKTEKTEYFLWLMSLFYFIAILGIIEALFPPIGNIISLLYKDGRYVLKGKAVFSFISPYCLATILVLPIFYYFLLFFAEKKIRNLFYFTVCLLAMFLTQSKTVFLGFVLTFLIMLITIFRSKWLIGRKVLLKISVGVIIIVIILIPIIISVAERKFSYLYSGLKVFFNSLNGFDILKILNAQPSTKIRFEQLRFAMENQDSIPLIGVAIGKKVLMPESFYALYLYRTGIIGIAIHCLMVYFAAKRSYFSAKYVSKKNQTHFNIKLSCLYYALFIFFISLTFSYFSAAVTDQTRVAFFFYIFLGHLYSLDKNSSYKNKYVFEVNK